MTAFVVESWIWYSATMCMVMARMVARLLHFKSFLRLQIEDFLMTFLACLYTILIVFLNVDLNVSTNLIDPAHPVELTPEEISKRTWGAKTVLLVEQCMCAVQWGTKTCLLLLYWRLTQNLKQNLVVKCAAVYVGVTYVVMEILYFAVWCRPFHDYWQTPTDNTQCTTALHHLITNLVFNLTSDILIMSIPLPLFLRAHLELKRKALLVFPFSLGMFTILCAILSKRLSFTQPYSSEWVYWYCREASTAMIVTNMPYSWALIRRIFNLRSFFGDSTADQMQGGQPTVIHGHSAGAFALEGRPRSRQASHAEGRWNFSWQQLKPHQKHRDDAKEQTTPPTPSWQTSATDKDKEINVETTPASGSSSSAGSVRKPRVASSVDWTIDRLYPLDDEEVAVPDVTRRRYEG
ncbi:uncharacterized protein Z518_00575 [Rhinocladiella mackenziei CBS 650.93]|uniref:Rhodopsin domain-containing protein n=1 Tax=Rhinocladiella mackenziei CBS 650.93 TaxID=1442369 RepID=A0A0D2JJB8_9EURO|nr:uncharacterized protein Z518_00575 [Rhinocladiella mackenziei CBS 650.93]KIX09495.1 hypothetical protein Z518_00575 [Rhinocladiella mackenziei CBS 650.93]